MNKLQTKIQRRLVKAMGAWRDPHMTKPLLESENIQAIDISEEGNVQIKFKPSRPHCPCCLIDAKELKLHLEGTKGVNSIHLEIVDVPASERWSRLVND